MTRPVVPAENGEAMSLEQRVQNAIVRCHATPFYATKLVIALCRESIARDLEAELLPGPGEKGYGIGNGVHNEALTLAARIARNGAST